MAKWTLDKSHSEIGFKVKHLVITTVSGKFNSFDANVESSKDDFSDAKIEFSADINSIDTGNTQRDTHLKSPDFFDAANHPTLNFVSRTIEKNGSDYTITGDLTIRGTRKEIVLQAEFGGVVQNLYGQTVAGFELTGKVNRQEFGLTWGAVTEAGGLVVSNDVKIVANVELVKQ